MMAKPGANTSDDKSREKIYIAIDLKSFYASVECTDRSLDALRTNLVVADSSRTSKTICLAVTPSLKAYGISGRARLFEVEQAVKEINKARLAEAIRLGKAVVREVNGRKEYGFSGSSFQADALEQDPSLELSFIIAPPQMRRYMEISSSIYQIYLKYIAPEDIHVYSIDEVFMDVTGYLKTYQLSPEELARIMIREVLYTTGITATAGIGSNLYLCKVAMDIVAKHMPADENGVRIAALTEQTYREILWTHEPLTDFWRVGHGIAKKLREYQIYTMGDIARCSLGGPGDFYNEDLLYRIFGINAELLIDHAWGWEPVTIAEIKSYKPVTNSLSNGQVLHCAYDAEQAKLITREMIDQLSLELVEHGLLTNQIVLTIGYDVENLSDPERRKNYYGPVHKDHYGRYVPKHAHGTANIGYTSSTRKLTELTMNLYDSIIQKNLLIRRINVTACKLIPESEYREEVTYEQMDLFTDYAALEQKRKAEEVREESEKRVQKALLQIRKKYGKNAVLKGMNLEEGATARERNEQVGGHKA